MYAACVLAKHYPQNKCHPDSRFSGATSCVLRFLRRLAPGVIGISSVPIDFGLFVAAATLPTLAAALSLLLLFSLRLLAPRPLLLLLLIFMMTTPSPDGRGSVLFNWGDFSRLVILLRCLDFGLSRWGSLIAVASILVLLGATSAVAMASAFAALARFTSLTALTFVSVMAVPSSFFPSFSSWGRARRRPNTGPDAVEWHLPLDIITVILNIKSAVVMLCDDLCAQEPALFPEVRFDKASDLEGTARWLPIGATCV